MMTDEARMNLFITAIGARPRLLVGLDAQADDGMVVHVIGVDHYVVHPDFGEIAVPRHVFDTLWELGQNKLALQTRKPQARPPADHLRPLGPEEG